MIVLSIVVFINLISLLSLIFFHISNSYSCFFSGERMAFISVFLTLPLSIILFKNQRKTLLLFLIITMCVAPFVTKNTRFDEIKNVIAQNEDKKTYFSEYFLSSINFNGMTEKLIKERPGMPLRVAKAVTLATVYALHADLVIEECKKEERFEDIIDEDVLYEENQ